MAKKGKTFEEQLGRLEETVQRLEQDELSLDEMLKLYAEGVELARSCRERLDEASARLQGAESAAGEEEQG